MKKSMVCALVIALCMCALSGCGKMTSSPDEKSSTSYHGFEKMYDNGCGFLQTTETENSDSQKVFIDPVFEYIESYEDYIDYIDTHALLEGFIRAENFFDKEYFVSMRLPKVDDSYCYVFETDDGVRINVGITCKNYGAKYSDIIECEFDFMNKITGITRAEYDAKFISFTDSRFANNSIMSFNSESNKGSVFVTKGNNVLYSYMGGQLYTINIMTDNAYISIECSPREADMSEYGVISPAYYEKYHNALQNSGTWLSGFTSLESVDRALDELRGI